MLVLTGRRRASDTVLYYKSMSLKKGYWEMVVLGSN